VTAVDVSLVTLPTPLLMPVDEAFETVHERKDDWPAVIDDGFAAKELITGKPALAEHVVPPGVIV
jgi:hypothetical protein